MEMLVTTRSERKTNMPELGIAFKAAFVGFDPEPVLEGVPLAVLCALSANPTVKFALLPLKVAPKILMPTSSAVQ
jgi:hypothetical protein